MMLHLPVLQLIQASQLIEKQESTDIEYWRLTQIYVYHIYLFLESTHPFSLGDNKVKGSSFTSDKWSP